VENDGMRWAAVMGSKNMNAFGDNFFGKFYGTFDKI
jgi:hypothetical protein